MLVHTRPVLYNYRARVCSQAFVVWLVLTAAAVLIPLFIAMESHGFLLREFTKHQQAYVRFSRQFVLDMYGHDSQSGHTVYRTYSTVGARNSLLGSSLVMPTVTAYEPDADVDGRLDGLRLRIEVPLAPNDQISSMEALLFFSFEVETYSKVSLNSAVYIDASSGFHSTAGFAAFGDISLVQHQPFPFTGTVDRTSQHIVPDDAASLDELSMKSLLASLQAQNVSLDLERLHVSQSGTRVGSDPLILEFSIDYPSVAIRYEASVWQELKWMWIQYVAILVVVLFVIHHVRELFFTQQLVYTAVSLPDTDGLRKMD